jgi:3-phenylpropionate/cinnamic acid dioxygenase small subunit
MLEWWRTVPAMTVLDDDRDAARRAVIGEARLLDDDRLDDWLAEWEPDGILWVPIDAGSNPGADQSFFLDDVRRLRERVEWRRQSSAWSQRPAVRAVRSVANVESHLADDGSLRVRSTLTIVERRGDKSHTWAGHQFHVLAPATSDGVRRRRVKVICIPELGAAVPHPGVVL